MRRNGGILISWILFFLLVSCGEKFSTYRYYVVPAREELSSNDTILTDSLQGFPFSRVQQPGGIGLSSACSLEETVQNKRMFAVFEGRVRTNFAQTLCSISLSGNGGEDNACMLWKAVPLKYYITKTNTWCRFKDSIFIPGNVNGKPFRNITAMLFMGGIAGERVDMDTLKVWYKVSSK